MKRFTQIAGMAGLAALVLAGCMTPAESNALTLINRDRVANAAAPLREHGHLVTKAQDWARYLADRSGGRCSMETLVHSDLRAGAPPGWRALGENVGCRIAPGTVESFVEPLQQAFLASPGHRRNIMNGAYRAGGVGIAVVPAAVGNGWVAVYEAQEFANV